MEHYNSILALNFNFQIDFVNYIKNNFTLYEKEAVLFHPVNTTIHPKPSLNSHRTEQ